MAQIQGELATGKEEWRAVAEAESHRREAQLALLEEQHQRSLLKHASSQKQWTQTETAQHGALRATRLELQKERSTALQAFTPLNAPVTIRSSALPCTPWPATAATLLHTNALIVCLACLFSRWLCCGETRRCARRQRLRLVTEA